MLRWSDATRRYLVTGGAGFIGSHLCDRLVAEGADVLALDDLSTGSVENVAHLIPSGRFRLVVGDVMDEKVVATAATGADVIVHLAAAVGVRRIIERPLESLRTNVRGTEVVLEVARRTGARILVASTSEVYGKGVRVPFREDDDRLLGPTERLRWSYSVSKALDEILAHAYWADEGVPAVVARLFNTVGPRQTGAYGMVIPRMVEAALAGRPVEVYGDGEQTRCFGHVQDVVEALIALVDHPEAPGEAFNIGSQEEVSINELAERVLEMTRSRSPIVHVPYESAYGPGFEDLRRRVPCTRKINALIGWEPRRGLSRIISDVIAERRAPARTTAPDAVPVRV